ncbi:MAG: hypothetical protein KKH98_00755 [Spirochaetes bacterium]|nr:hypothetical protein [Spirochaetota bacterium]
MTLINKMAVFSIAGVLLLPAIAMSSANKVIATSGWKNDEKNCVTKPWVKALDNKGEFKKHSYKYAEYTWLDNNGMDSIEDDIYKLAKKIDAELTNPRFDGITRIDLVGHSKGGAAVYFLSKIIANPESSMYKKLLTDCPNLMTRWKNDKLFIENVVTVAGTLNGTRLGLKALANLPIISQIMKKKLSEGTKDLAELDTTKVENSEISKIDYLRLYLKDGFSHNTFIHMRSDSIVPRTSSGISYKGDNIVVSGDHGTAFDPNNSEFDRTSGIILNGLTHDPNDKSDYNEAPVTIFTVLLKDMPGIGVVVNTLPKKIGSFFVGIGRKIKEFFISKKKSSSGSESSGEGIEWTSLEEVENEIFGLDNID